MDDKYKGSDRKTHRNSTDQRYRNLYSLDSINHRNRIFNATTMSSDIQLISTFVYPINF